jgi:hypothetical protein
MRGFLYKRLSEKALNALIDKYLLICGQVFPVQGFYTGHFISPV